MKKIKFSIIIPAYNAEKTIKSCVDSVLAQDYDSYEIIIVDDGSKDATARILRKEYGNNKKITILSQENKGVSAARNRALNEASGEWVIFLDSDDKMIPGSLAKLSNAMDENSADLVITRIITENDSAAPIESKLFAEDKSIILDRIIFNEDKRDSFELSSFINRGIGGKVYRRAIIKDHNLSFNTSLKVFEDGIFNVSFLLNAKSALFSDCVFYYYYEDNPDSRTNTTMKDADNNNLIVLSELSLLASAHLYKTDAINNVALLLFIPSVDSVITNKKLTNRKKYARIRELMKEYSPYLKKANKKLYSRKKRFELFLSKLRSPLPLFIIYSAKHLRG